MNDDPVVTTAVLGGEVRHRRGMQNTAVRTFVMVVLVVGGAWIGNTAGLLGGLVLAGLMYGLSLQSGGDASVTSNLAARRRWRRHVRKGYDRFEHVSNRPVNCQKGSREWNAYRDFTDGDDEWEWLSDPDPDAVGIMYHDPADRSGLYFSVTFRVDGQLVGLASDAELEAAQTDFGDLLAGWGSRQALVTSLQITTRMLPPHTVRHQQWMGRQLDPATPNAQVADYQNLLRKITENRYVQRHYVTLRFAKTDRFDAAAAGRGKGLAGWKALVLAQTESAMQRLIEAGYRRPAPLTAPQHLAVLRHLQSPGFDPDATADITATNWYRPSLSSMYAVTTDDQWVHSTAQFAPDGIATSERDGLWLRPLLLGMTERLYRTVSIHIHLVAAADAKVAALTDATSDEADQIADVRNGKRQDSDKALSLSAAQRRIDDLTAGQGHHGALWVGFVTVTVPVDGSIGLARALTEEAASNCDIDRLEWLDSLQPAAQCFTWPIGRAVRPPRTKLAARVLETASIKTGVTTSG